MDNIFSSTFAREITNPVDLVKYIRLMLGEPLIQVELQDEHIYQIIKDTVKIYTDVAYGFYDDRLVYDFNSDSSFSLRLQDVVEVQNVTSLCGTKNIGFKWDSIKRKLTVTGETSESKIMVHVLKQYTVDAEFDLIFNESWVKDYAKAKTQLLWGQVLGKYSQALVGGANINYDRLISEAQSEIEKLNEELQEKWVDPAPVLVG